MLASIRSILTLASLAAASMGAAAAQDECSSATPVGSGAPWFGTVDTASATSSGPWSCTSHVHPDVWFHIPTFAGARPVRVDIAADATLEILSGVDCSNLESVACTQGSGGSTEIVIVPLQGEDLWARVALDPASTQAAQIRVWRDNVNDDCSLAARLPFGWIHFGPTAASLGTSGLAWPCGAPHLDRDVWYRIDTPETKTYGVRTCNAGRVAVYEGDCGSLVPIACADPVAGCPDADVEFAAAAGGSYLVRIGVPSGSTSSVYVKAVDTAPNSTCATATPIGVGTFDYDTDRAPVTPMAGCWGNETRRVWYEFDVPVDGILSAVGTTGYAVIENGACGAGVELACQDSTLVTGGTTVRIHVNTLNPSSTMRLGRSGSFTVEFEPLATGWGPATGPNPTAKDGLAALADGRLVTFESTQQSYRIDVQDPSTGTWESHTSQVAGPVLTWAAEGERLFVVTSGSLGGPIVVEEWDTTSWTSTLHTRPSGAPWCAIAITEDTLVLAGGLSAQGFPVRALEVLDRTTGQWTSLQLAAASAGMSAGVVGRRAYFLGGSNVPSPPVPQYLDLDTLQVGVLAAAPHGHGSPAFARGAPLVRHGSDLILVQGGTGQLDTLDVYHTESDTWSTLTLPEQRVDHVLGIRGDELIAAGGRDPQDPFGRLQSAAVHDFSTQSWRTDGVDLGHVAGFADTREASYVLSGSPTDPTRLTRYAALEAAYGCGPAVTTASGDRARIDVYGSARVADQDLRLVVTGTTPGQPGIFVVGSQVGSTPMAVGVGTLCVAGQLGRFTAPTQFFTGPVGRTTVDLGALPTTPVSVVAPGETWTFQAWFRDGAQLSNLSDAVSVTFL